MKTILVLLGAVFLLSACSLQQLVAKNGANS